MNDSLNEAEYLGRGLPFPMRVTPTGRMALTGGREDIEQAIVVILGTVPGERVMRPRFGCRAWEVVFEPNIAVAHALCAQYVREALAMWEPRINVVEVQVYRGDLDSAGRVNAADLQVAMVVEVRYEIKATHDQRSIVYPFYGEDENQE
jgi:hypothetical protein